MAEPTEPEIRVVRIEPSTARPGIDVGEVFAYRDLLALLVLRDITVLYKQTVLGFSWAIIRPVFQMVIFTIVFGNLAGVSSDGAPYALFSYAALIPWTYFAAAFTDSSASLVSSAPIITKVYFPRILIPITPVVAKLVDFLIAFSVLAVLMVYYRVVPTANVIFLPVLVLVMMTFAMALGLWMSALAVQYRDVKHAVQFVVQLMMYAAPVVWPSSLVLERFGQAAYRLYGLYPMVGVIEGFRSALIGSRPMPYDLIALGAVSSVVLLLSGLLYFRRMERRFADVA